MSRATARERRRVTATYRLQLRGATDLDAARALVPYLARLGVSHLYLSPVLRARPGSAHGYDGVDPTEIDPALGGERALAELARALHAEGMGMILDVVPNHLAADPASPFFDELLAHGRASACAAWFDVDWERAPGSRPRLDLPFLGAPLAQELARGALALERAADGLRVRYCEQSFPLDPASWPALLRPAARRLPAAGSDGARSAALLRALARRLARLPPPARGDAEARAARAGSRARAAGVLAALAEREPEAARALDAALAELTAGEAGRRRLARLLGRQPYRLGFWRRLRGRLQYRRFFDVNDLVALRAEAPEVFRATHARLLEAVERGWADGLRVDHVDGLGEPETYLHALRRAAGARAAPEAPHPFPLLVEKILAPGETLPESWPVQGTTGYEFAARTEAALLDAQGTRRVHEAWHRITGRREGFAECVLDAKRHVLRRLLEPDVRRAAAAVTALRSVRGEPPVPEAELRRAAREAAAQLEVYRSYLAPRGAPRAEDRARLERALDAARASGRAPERALRALEGALLGGEESAPAAADARARARARFQQLTGPAAAKGVEDTALYRFGPLLSQNEVGAHPDPEPRGALAAFHADARERLARAPGSLLAASTHDSKRSADLRARLDVLSEIPERWAEAVARWRAEAGPLRSGSAQRPLPDAAAEYHVYQTLVGLWPVGERGAPSEPAELESLRARLLPYLEKAAREAKERTSWLDPDPEYESALLGFAGALLRAPEAAALRAEIARFAAGIARPGLWNALARTALQLAAPGVPDLYQGDELFRLSLVDPDNRRPVDFARRRRMLEALEAEAGTARANATGTASGAEALTALARATTRAPEDGRCKLHLIRAGLHARRRDPELFASGAYAPLAARGARAAHALAFARHREERALLCVAPRLPLTLAGGDPERAPTGALWEDTALLLPPELAGRRWSSLLTGATLRDESGALPLARLLADFPVGLWGAGAAAERAAG